MNKIANNIHKKYYISLYKYITEIKPVNNVLNSIAILTNLRIS